LREKVVEDRMRGKKQCTIHEKPLPLPPPSRGGELKYKLSKKKGKQ
jgi:hypothetical protein